MLFTPRQNEGYCDHNMSPCKTKTLPRGSVAPSGFWFLFLCSGKIIGNKHASFIYQEWIDMDRSKGELGITFGAKTPVDGKSVVYVSKVSPVNLQINSYLDQTYSLP